MTIKTEYNLSKLKKRLLNLRLNAGLTQKELAGLLGIKNVKTIISAENETNKTIPDTKTILAYCNFFECDIDYLYGIIDNKTHDTDFICKYTGLSENTVVKLRIYSQSPKQEAQDYITAVDLSIIATDIFEYFKQYFNVRSGNFALIEVSNEIAKEEENVLLDFPPEEDNVLLDFAPEIARQAILKKVQDELDSIKQEYLEKKHG